jgi:type III secretion protein J
MFEKRWLKQLKQSKWLILVLLFLLSGCKTELYSGLPENEANEMLSVLLTANISAEKLPGKKGVVDLKVERSQISAAIQVLKAHGFPKREYATLGQVFKKEGLISSPLEERARYIHAVSEELSETISRIDGVLSTRVHVVLPEVSQAGSKLNPSSASVFVKHDEDVELNAYIPKIKLLVNNSIEGLDYEKITVVLFPSRVMDKQLKQPELQAKAASFSSDAAGVVYFVIFTVMAVILGLAFMVYSGKIRLVVED